jgi:hypothetical protein
MKGRTQNSCKNDMLVGNESFLTELANLQDSGLTRFRNRWRYDSHQEEAVMDLRDPPQSNLEKERDTGELNRLLRTICDLV